MAEAGIDLARRILTDAVSGRVFPAAAAEVGESAGTIWRESIGRLTFDGDAPLATHSTIFDLASLTKPLATTALVLELVASGRLRLDEPLAGAFPEWRGADRVQVTVSDLLEHASGLPARLLDRPPASRREFEHEICTMPLEYAPRTKSVYSDLGFILLGFLAADRAGRSMRSQFAQITSRLPIERPQVSPQVAGSGFLDFGPLHLTAASIAPTEPLEDDPRRGVRLVGEVHDQYAFLLGGAAGHAGLFGNVLGVSALARAVLRTLRAQPDAGLPPPLDPVAQAVRRSKVPGSSRALGWDTMLPSSSCGPCMSAASFGHVGFTGTSLWTDPENDRYFILLTNRACGGGTPAHMQQVRRAFHDALAGV